MTLVVTKFRSSGLTSTKLIGNVVVSATEWQEDGLTYVTCVIGGAAGLRGLVKLRAGARARATGEEDPGAAFGRDVHAHTASL